MHNLIIFDFMKMQHIFRFKTSLFKIYFFLKTRFKMFCLTLRCNVLELVTLSVSSKNLLKCVTYAYGLQIIRICWSAFCSSFAFGHKISQICEIIIDEFFNYPALIGLSKYIANLHQQIPKRICLFC